MPVELLFKFHGNSLGGERKALSARLQPEGMQAHGFFCSVELDGLLMSGVGAFGVGNWQALGLALQLVNSRLADLRALGWQFEDLQGRPILGLPSTLEGGALRDWPTLAAALHVCDPQDGNRLSTGTAKLSPMGEATYELIFAPFRDPVQIKAVSMGESLELALDMLHRFYDQQLAAGMLIRTGEGGGRPHLP